MLRPDNGAQTSRFHDSEGDSQYLRDLPNYNSSSEVNKSKIHYRDRFELNIIHHFRMHKKARNKIDY